MLNVTVEIKSFENNGYRGIDRDDIINEKHFNKSKCFDELMEYYYAYVNDFLDENLDCLEFLKKIFPFYKKLKANDIPCEIIAYSDCDISESFDGKLLFLGYDIVNDCCESLISYSEYVKLVKPFLNSNGLCADIGYVEKIKSTLSFVYKNADLETYYVYKVITSLD